MNHIRVRAAHSEEHDHLVSLYLTWGYRGGVDPLDVVYVAEHSGRVVGLVRRCIDRGVTVLRGMHVDSACQRQGIGSRLLDHLVSNLGLVECFCIPFAHLATFYGRGGFVIVSDALVQPFLLERMHSYQQQGRNVVMMHRAADRQERDRAG